MGALLALAAKDLKLLLRDKTGFFFTLIFPVLMAVFFGAVFSGGSSGTSAISVVLVDEDDTAESRAFTATLVAASELAIEASSREAAVDLVSRGKRVAYLILPKGFGAARERVFWGAPPTVIVGVDPARRAEASMLEGIVTRYLVEGFQRLFSDPEASDVMLGKALKGLEGAEGLPQAAALKGFFEALGQFNKQMASGAASVDEDGWAPAKVDVTHVVREGRAPPNYFSISFPQGIVWGLMMCAMTFGLGLVTERTAGTLMRLRVAPISRAQILGGKAVACFTLVLMLQLGLMALGTLMFGVVLGSPAALVMAVFASSVCFVGVMMLLSVLGRTEKAASGYGTAMMLVLMMVGGGMIPLFAMPGWMQTVSHASPVKWAVLALEGATWRDFSVSEMAIPCGILIAAGLACFAVGTKLFRDS